MTTAAKQTLTAAIGFLKAIRDNEIDGTERRQIHDTGYAALDLGYNDTGCALVDYSVNGWLDDETDFDSLILTAENHLKFADEAA